MKMPRAPSVALFISVQRGFTRSIEIPSLLRRLGTLRTFKLRVPERVIPIKQLPFFNTSKNEIQPAGRYSPVCACVRSLIF